MKDETRGLLDRRGFITGKKLDLFDRFHGDTLISSLLNAFQRAYAYNLEHGLHVVIADMQSFKHLEENIVAAATSHQYAAS